MEPQEQLVASVVDSGRFPLRPRWLDTAFGFHVVTVRNRVDNDL